MFSKNIREEFKEFLKESNKINVYKGSNIPIKINSLQMRNKNSDEQNGVGVFFSTDINDAYLGGSDIYTISVDKHKYVNSKERLSTLGKDIVVNLLKYLHNIDHEHLYYLIADYGYEISDPEDMTDIDIENLFEMMKNEEIGTFQVDMSNMFGVDIFTEAWNKTTKLDGTFNKMLDGHVWYAIINTDINVKK